MIDPVAQVSMAAENMAVSTPPMAKTQALPPEETKTFAVMMRDAMGGGGNVGAATDPNPVERAVLSQGKEYSDGLEKLDNSRKALIESSRDTSDPMMTMWRATEFSFQSNLLFTRLHIATGISNSASNSFNTLLKSQQ